MLLSILFSIIIFESLKVEPSNCNKSLWSSSVLETFLSKILEDSGSSFFSTNIVNSFLDDICIVLEEGRDLTSFFKILLTISLL